MSQADGELAAEQKRRIAGAFSRAAPEYDNISFFHCFGSRLVALADIHPGARVLDAILASFVESRHELEACIISHHDTDFLLPAHRIARHPTVSPAL